jgi:hypothetical protein
LQRFWLSCAGRLTASGQHHPLPGEIVIYEERASAFFGTPLIAHLRKVGAQTA